MIKVLFILLRIATAICALAGLAGALFLFLVVSVAGFVKQGAGVLWSVVTLFASGFQKSTPPPEPDRFAWLPFCFAMLFLAMFVSVFLPGQKIFVHLLAVGAGVAAIWRIWIMATVPGSDALYLPIVVLWFVYYLVCLRRM